MLQIIWDTRGYFFWLLMVSLFCWALERIAPWRPQEKAFRPQFGQDLFWLVFNGHYAGVLLAAVSNWALQSLSHWSFGHDLLSLPAIAFFAGRPLWLQFVVFLVVKDFLEWGIHNLLHRISWLWEFHKLHHRIQELDWIGNMRFHWMEIVVYRGLTYFPLFLLGVNNRVILSIAIFSTLVGHLNHSNLNLDWGVLRYVLNSPRLHVWHHDMVLYQKAGQNFGVVFSLWDFLFGTAYFPAQGQPAQLGFENMEDFPQGLTQRLVYPFWKRRTVSGDLMSLGAISLETLRGWLDERKPVTVVDVRPVAQRSEWSIPGSLHVDAYEALKAHDPEAMSEIQLPLDRPVVTVCAMGRVSALAAQQLRDRGYQALSLDGGMKAWSLAWNTAEVALKNNSTRVIQVRRTGKGCLSYLVGSRNEATTIDASLPPEVYLNIATKLGWRITDVLDTHIHADHLSRSRQLALLTGAVLHLPMQGRVTYSFRPILDSQCVEFGEARLTALLTPGHTAESTCYLLDDEVLFTGDTLFLGGVGRPDLEAAPEDARLRPEKLHASLQKVLKLPAETLVLPGHVSQPVPFDGIPMCARLDEVSERITNLRLSVSDFVNWVLDRIPPTPPNHHRIIQFNEQGLWPEGDPTDLEAGANRCAVS